MPPVRKVLIWILRGLGALLLVAFLFVFAFAGWVYWQTASGLPDHRLEAGKGSWHGCVPPHAQQEFVPLSAMPANAIIAFLAAEEPDFLTREATNPLVEIGRRIYEPHSHTGGSPISAYYTRALFYCHLPDTYPPGWHFKYALLHYRVERDLPRRNILETVINSANFGHGAHGLAAAAQRYFRRPLRELSVGELALLAGLARSPSALDPERHADKALKRRDAVLDRMAEMGAVTPEQLAAAKLEPLNLRK